MSALDKLEKVYSFPDQKGLILDAKIPDGEYLFKVLNHITCTKFGFPRLEIKCSIIDGEYFSTELSRWYCLDHFKGKAGTKGKFVPKRRGDFMIEYCGLFPLQNVTRLDRVPMEPFYSNIILGRTRTVKINNQQKRLPEQLQYSAIAEFLRVEK